MNNTLKKFISDEFNHFKSDLLNNWGISEKTISPIDHKLKHIYRNYLSLACASTVIGKNTRAKEYLTAIIESNYIVQVLALKNISNPVFSMLRQSIELTLKYIYLNSHPIEYHWTKSRNGYRELNFQLLLEFISRTDEHKDLSV